MPSTWFTKLDILGLIGITLGLLAVAYAPTVYNHVGATSA